MRNGSGGGVGLGTLLFVVFLVLKLTNVITWSWWLVFLPLIIPIGILMLLYMIIGVIAVIEGF